MKDNSPTCKFNIGVGCDGPEECCLNCGWNPEVDAKRKAITRTKLKDMNIKPFTIKRKKV